MDTGLPRTLKDGGVLCSLLIALMLVYAFDRKPTAIETSPANTPKEETIKPPPAKPLRLAVMTTHPSYDDIGKLLGDIGGGLPFTAISLEKLPEPDALAKFDVLFLACSGVPISWVQETGPGVRGMMSGQGKPEIIERVRSNLRKFVEEGGTLYASDLHLDLVSLAFPELTDYSVYQTGRGLQQVVAEVVDSGLRDLLGPKLTLYFDQNGWKSAAFKGKEIVLLRGTFKTTEGQDATTPLLVKFPFAKGTVIFTSFHNEKQNSKTEEILLRYLVLSALTARSESQATTKMISGGFSPQKRNILSANKDKPSQTFTYECTRRGTLRFVLSFENQGAQLKLTVKGPGGETQEKQGESTFELEVPDAAAGAWEYTITAEKVPYAEFPYNLVIGQKAS